MKLHNNKESFNELIKIVSDYYKIDESLIEKDYYVTLLLEELTIRIPNLIFKGGTSLSKCYKIIDRFSEDIDLTLDENYQTQSQKKQMKNEIVASCKSLGLYLENLEEIRSRRDYNCYRVQYPNQYNSSGIKPYLLIETTYITKSYPSEFKFASSIIYDYLKENNKVNIIKKYELEPFKIRVQSLNRTFIDKVFAICDYYISGRIERNSRHIYDLYRLLTNINLDDSLKKLIQDVYIDRKHNMICYSAQDGVSIPEILNNIIENKIYKDDYERITTMMLFKNLEYDEVITAIVKIVKSGVFEINN